MKAKEFKEIVSKIPDDDELIFTYSRFVFENIGDIFKGKEILKYFYSSPDAKYCVPHSKRTWMIEFDD